jgi:hypothetical protein
VLKLQHKTVCWQAVHGEREDGGWISRRRCLSGFGSQICLFSWWRLLRPLIYASCITLVGFDFEDLSYWIYLFILVCLYIVQNGTNIIINPSITPSCPSSCVVRNRTLRPMVPDLIRLNQLSCSRFKA